LLLLPCPDVYVVVSPPLLLGLAARILGAFKRAPFVFHVQDLQPDAAMGLGMLRGGPLVRALYWLEAVAYRSAARVSGISEGMIAAYRRKGVSGRKCILFPNSVALPGPDPLPARGAFRRRMHWPEDAFLAVYSGNLGVKQGLDVLLDAARQLADPRIRVVICGDGARREHLERRIRSESIANATLLPLQPDAQYRELLADTDIAVITQQAGAGACFLPSKLLTTLAFGKPVLAVADSDSELVRAMKTGRFGLWVSTGQASMLARRLSELRSDRASLRRFGVAGREYVQRFESGRVHAEFERQLLRLVMGQDALSWAGRQDENRPRSGRSDEGRWHHRRLGRRTPKVVQS
jgi:colanic acid biosynthesis glycosyl transferase WcaI